MSSILKALKKLEEEKTTLQDEKKLDISRELLKQPGERRISVKWLWLLGTSAAAVILSLVYALYQKPAVVIPTPPAEPPATQAPQAIQPMMPALPPSRSDTISVTPQRHQVPPQPAEPQLQKRQAHPVKPSENPAPPGSQTPSGELHRSVTTEQPAASAVAPQPTDSRLILSGIAWNKDSAERLAVINGQPLATGAVVNGSVVEEIMPDRVRMSQNGRRFDLFIGKGAN